MKFNAKHFFHLIYITIFESRSRGVVITPQRVLILFVFLFVLVPIFLIGAQLGWLLDKIFYSGFREQEVRQPVFVIGNPRSGTTFLHRLLARDVHNFLTFMTWELGFAPTIWQRRLYYAIARVDRWIGGPLAWVVNLINTRMLHAIDKHPTGLFKAEEDDLILLYVWSSTFALGVFPYPNEVLPRVVDFDQRPDERERVLPFYRKALQRHMYAHHAEHQHFLSKNPVFSSRVDGLYETFPDARFIYLIRNPLNVLGSLGSYARMVWKDFQGAEAEFPHDDHVWNVVNKWYRYTLNWLDQAPDESYIIVRFNDLTTNPRQTVERIYDHFNIELTPEYSEILDEATVKARQYESEHDYSLEDTAYTREQIVEEYRDLFERFDFDTGE